MYVGNAWCMKSYLRKVVLFSTIYNTGTHLQTVLFVYINYICSALILICQVVAGLYIYIYIYIYIYLFTSRYLDLSLYVLYVQIFIYQNIYKLIPK